MIVVAGVKIRRGDVVAIGADGLAYPLASALCVDCGHSESVECHAPLGEPYRLTVACLSHDFKKGGAK